MVFCDLRGFAAFSSRAEPETIIGVLRKYYDVLEKVVSDHGATLINYSGDGVHGAAERPCCLLRPGIARRQHGDRHAGGRAEAP